jgi:hypothetical protein
MSLPIRVDAYSGCKANERPSQFVLDEEIYEIAAVLDQWYELSAMYFKVQSTEGKTYLLRYDEPEDEWTLQSGFDGDELLVRPSIQLVTIDAATAKKAEQQIESCEHCHSDDAEIPFDWIIAEMTGKRGPIEFILSESARCPNCKHSITEKPSRAERKLAVSIAGTTGSCVFSGCGVQRLILFPLFSEPSRRSDRYTHTSDRDKPRRYKF